MNQDFATLADIVQSTTFANCSNSPVTVGLAMAEERGLPADLKLRVFKPKDLTKHSEPFCAFRYNRLKRVSIEVKLMASS